MKKKIREFCYKNEKLKRMIEDFDIYWDIVRRTRKMGKVIYKCMKGCTPALSYEDCCGIAMCILSNDADGMRMYLSYTDEATGETIFPR